MANKAPSTPTFPDVMANFRKDLAYRLYCHLPGEIVSYDRATMTAAVKVALKQVIPDYAAATGFRTASYPQLASVPVFFLSAGAASAGGDPVAGDPCLLCILDRNMDAWKINGGVEAPLSPRAHDLADAFVFVGFRPTAQPLVSARAAGEFGVADARAAVVVKDGLISVRNGPLPANSLGGILDTMLTAMGAASSVAEVAAAATAAKAALDTLLY
jgi:hypothetical protein